MPNCVEQIIWSMYFDIATKTYCLALISLLSVHVEAMHVCAHAWNVQEGNGEGEERFDGALCVIP